MPLEQNYPSIPFSLHHLTHASHRLWLAIALSQPRRRTYPHWQSLNHLILQGWLNHSLLYPSTSRKSRLSCLKITCASSCLYCPVSGSIGDFSPLRESCAAPPLWPYFAIFQSVLWPNWLSIFGGGRCWRRARFEFFRSRRRDLSTPADA